MFDIKILKNIDKFNQILIFQIIWGIPTFLFLISIYPIYIFENYPQNSYPYILGLYAGILWTLCLQITTLIFKKIINRNTN